MLGGLEQDMAHTPNGEGSPQKRKHDGFEWATLIATICGVIVLCVYTGLTGYQALVSERTLKEIRSGSAQTERAINAATDIARETADSVVASNKLVDATTEAVKASKRLADETAASAAISKRLADAAETANTVTRSLAEAAAKSNQISHDALLVGQRPFMFPISVDLLKITASSFPLGSLGAAIPSGDKPLSWQANVKWENSGNTPTRELVIDTYCLLSAEAMTEPYHVQRIKHFNIREGNVLATDGYKQILYETEQQLLFGPKQTYSGGICYINPVDILFQLIVPGSTGYHNYVRNDHL